MIFSSLEFIFIFLPILLIIYYITPNKYRNYVLLFGSIIFYFIGVKDHQAYMLLLAISVIINYFIGRLIGKNKKYSKIMLIFGIIYNLSFLFVFKYYDFVVSIISKISTKEIKTLNLTLPLGISFYTFQVIGYLIDVYKEKYDPEKSILNFSTNMIFFEKIISGPIVQFDDIKKQLEGRPYKLSKFIQGVRYFIVGLGLKTIIADNIGIMWNDILMIGIESISTPLAWLGIFTYAFEIYFDFWGYSVMAQGIGKMFGIDIPDNFNLPYLSKSFTEFFRKWHITLGTWFKNYIYIPLGGNRKGTIRTLLNLFIVWVITGLWHGANWNFIIWGIFIWILIVNEKLWLKKYLDKYPIIGHIYMMFFIPLTWTIFNITNLSQLNIMFEKLFPFFGSNEVIDNLDFVKYIKDYGILMIISLICSTKLPKNLIEGKEYNWIEIVTLLAIFWLSVYLLYTGLSNPFLYFSF